MKKVNSRNNYLTTNATGYRSPYSIRRNGNPVWSFTTLKNPNNRKLQTTRPTLATFTYTRWVVNFGVCKTIRAFDGLVITQGVRLDFDVEWPLSALKNNNNVSGMLNYSINKALKEKAIHKACQ